jgi:hypothetical protein
VSFGGGGFRVFWETGGLKQREEKKREEKRRGEERRAEESRAEQRDNCGSRPIIVRWILLHVPSLWWASFACTANDFFNEGVLQHILNETKKKSSLIDDD